MQRCLVETAFALLKPLKNTILTENSRLFVMALLRIQQSDLSNNLSRMLNKETVEFKVSNDGAMDFDDSNPPTSGARSPTTQDQHYLMLLSEFTGIRDLFTDFTFNRKTNEKERQKLTT